MTETNSISDDFDENAPVSLTTAKETIGIILAQGIKDATSAAALEVVDRVAPKHKTEIALYIADAARWESKSLVDAAHKKALETLVELPADIVVEKSQEIYRSVHIKSDLKEKSFVTVLDAIGKLDGENKIAASLDFTHYIYESTQTSEQTSDIISRKTRVLTLTTEALEENPGYPFRDNVAGKLVVYAYEVDPAHKQNLIDRLKAMAPEKREQPKQAAHETTRPKKESAPSAAAVDLARSILDGMKP